ncbi:MAG: hypothetical protein JXA73_21925 [Acidobacteria bacterium]|nr:hypothetical protein [Acidobacteriota bacterium]
MTMPEPLLPSAIFNEVLPAADQPAFSRDFAAKRRRRAWMQGARQPDSAVVLDSTSRNPTERNADMPGSAAAIESL